MNAVTPKVRSAVGFYARSYHQGFCEARHAKMGRPLGLTLSDWGLVAISSVNEPVLRSKLS